MKKNNGFTLIEILAVVTIIGLIFILVIPKITTSLKNKKGDVDRTTTNLVLSATKLYVQEHSSKFDKEDGNVSCMPINMLVKKGYLEGPVKNVTDDLDITDTKSVRITYDKGFKYEIVGKKDCIASVFQKVFYDSFGNKYKRVEYIESDGIQYIDTGYYANNNTVVEAKLYTEETGNKNWFGGSIKNTHSYALNAYSKSTIEYIYNNSNVWSTIDVDDDVVGKIFAISFGDKIYINGNLIAQLSSKKFQDDKTIWLFVRNGNYGIGNIIGRIYYFKIYENEQLIHDYIPVVDKDNDGCLFDNVEKKCYYDNDGQGFKTDSSENINYTYQDVNGFQYKKVNYIQSTGTQYIDTGYYANNNTIVNAKLYTDETGNKNWFGGSGATTPAYVVNSWNSNQIEYRYGFNAWNRTDVLNNDVVGKIFTLSFGETIRINGKYVSQLNSNEFQDDKSLTIFARNGKYDSGMISGKVYYFMIDENEQLIRDYVPVIDEDEKPCFFDKVEKKCYYNQGTGEFLWG